MSREDDAYLKTIDRLEPEVAAIDAGGGWASIAISLRRIADALDRLVKPPVPPKKDGAKL